MLGCTFEHIGIFSRSSKILASENVRNRNDRYFRMSVSQIFSNFSYQKFKTIKEKRRSDQTTRRRTREKIQNVQSRKRRCLRSTRKGTVQLRSKFSLENK